MTKDYDLVVLGGGTGGYTAAIRASQLGMKVAVVEKKELGGTCLHRGCIPSKALLRSAEVFRQTKEASAYGIDTGAPTLQFAHVQERKNRIVQTLHQGVKGLMKKGHIDVFNGFGRILGPSIFSPVAGTISVEYENGDENTVMVPEHVLIASGSYPNSLSGLTIDGDYVLSSDEALHMESLPESMLIVGGGVIGIEWASMLTDFGVDVTILEYLGQILPTEDKEIAEEMEKQLSKKGVRVVKEAQVLSETLQKDKGVSLDADTSDGKETFIADKMLVCVGRAANTDHIGLSNTRIAALSGSIQTNDFYQTEEPHIYAIGDAIGGMQLAHVASREGIVAVEHMAGKNPLPLDYHHVPNCIYSHPEAASVGLTEKQATDRNFDVKIGKIPFRAIGKAMVYGESEGFVKVIADRTSDDLLGIHMIGPHVTDMISEAGLAQVLDAAPWEVSHSIHPHPSLSEVIGEAALAVDGKQLHG
ncbi:dihydrolipoyl dehydrogenase [Lentibacillus halophilus]|uniref:Dihydrolipoyl dehydrogenase n=1 Tax=Lentibacillus halophilus TaxID=295065 RepID=A0ABN0ZCY8_9BACI